MAMTVTPGTQTATIGVAHDLATITTANVLVLEVDTAAMTATDVTELRAWGKTLSGGTERLLWVKTYYGVQTTGHIGAKKVSPPLASDISTRYTLTQTAGTGRAYPFKVIAL